MKGKPLQMVSIKDIGFFANLVFNYPDEYAGKYLSLAGATMTYEEANEIFQERTGQAMPVFPGPVGHILGKFGGEFTVMFKWLKAEGTAADVDECRRLHPGLTDFGTWLEHESDFRKA